MNNPPKPTYRYEELYFFMQIRTVKASPKGQFTIPRDLFSAMGGPQELVLIQDGHRLLVLPAHEVAQGVVDELEGWHHLATPALADVWDNDADEVWNEV
jgi:hypothetical protein